MIKFYIDRPKTINADEFELRMVFEVSNLRRELTLVTIRRPELEQLVAAGQNALKRLS